jgi:hypothetical protein
MEWVGVEGAVGGGSAEKGANAMGYGGRNGLACFVWQGWRCVVHFSLLASVFPERDTDAAHGLNAQNLSTTSSPVLLLPLPNPHPSPKPLSSRKRRLPLLLPPPPPLACSRPLPLALLVRKMRTFSNSPLLANLLPPTPYPTAALLRLHLSPKKVTALTSTRIVLLPRR